LADILQRSFVSAGIRLRSLDVVAVASKVVSTSERRIVQLKQVEVSAQASKIAKKWKLNPALAQLVLTESNEILGGIRGFLLTINRGILTANAGIDRKNTPPGTACLWPKNPDRSALLLRRFFQAAHGARVGVLIVDSRITPLRLGTTGLAIGSSGIKPIQDFRSKPDLYGRRIHVTQSDIIDDLAASAHLLLGESDERIGAVVIRGAPTQLSSSMDTSAVRMSKSRCLIMRNLSAG